jgi:hypothetical protein
MDDRREMADDDTQRRDAWREANARTPDLRETTGDEDFTVPGIAPIAGPLGIGAALAEARALEDANTDRPSDDQVQAAVIAATDAPNTDGATTEGEPVATEERPA